MEKIYDFDNVFRPVTIIIPINELRYHNYEEAEKLIRDNIVNYNIDIFNIYLEDSKYIKMQCAEFSKDDLKKFVNDLIINLHVSNVNICIENTTYLFENKDFKIWN